MIAIDYPTFAHSGRTLVVRYSLAAQVLMRRRGVEPARIYAALSPRLHPGDRPCMTDGPCEEPGCSVNPQHVQSTCIAFSACVAENFLDLTRPDRLDLNTAPSADYWAVQLDGELEQAQRVVIEAVLKISEARRKRLQAVAPPTESLVKAS